MRKITGLLGAAAALMLVATSANAASVIYNLTIDGSSGQGLSPGPFGTVQVTEDAGALDFIVTLKDAFDFNHTTASSTHADFAFDLTGSHAGVVLGSFSPSNYNFTSNGAISNEAPFGAFGYSVACGSCSNSDAPPMWAGPLTFTVSDTAKDLTLAALGYTTSSYGNVYFAADLFGHGATGNVGAIGPGTYVPEPATWLMMLTGLFGTGWMLRRARKNGAVAATA